MFIVAEKAFIKNVGEWPKWPLLPLTKRKGHEPAFLHVSSLTTVYKGNIWRTTEVAAEIRKETGKTEVSWGEVLDKHEKKEFATIEELLAEYRID